MMRHLSISLICGLTAAWTATGESIVVGKYPAKVVPEQISEIHLKENGIISLCAEPGKRLKKDDIIAEVNKEQTEHDRADLELELLRETISKEDEIRKLSAQRRRVEFYLSLSESERRYNTDFKGDDTAPTPEALADINRRIELLEKEIATLERRKKREFDLKHDPLIIRMPFDGQLQFNVPLPETAEERQKGFTLPENNMRTFATVCDDSAYYITVSITEGEQSLLDENKFSVSISLPEGKKLKGTFDHRMVERAGNGDALIYYFRIPQEDHATAHRMLGSRYTATLNYEVTGEVLRVNKAELAAHPQAAQCDDWEALVAVAYPDYAILIVGTRELVLCKKP
ncbi:MAG: hypothetical protein E7031_03965 [Akkermansiaceae bacterium]|nr:hypothetical protein [Akkermansiaceae bacterium]